MSLVDTVPGAWPETGIKCTAETSYGTAEIRMFRKDGLRTLQNLVWVSHGFQPPVPTLADNQKRQCSFAFLIPAGHTLEYRNANLELAKKVSKVFAEGLHQFTTQGIVSAFVGPHATDGSDVSVSQWLAAMLDSYDVALFEDLRWSEAAKVERTKVTDRLKAENAELLKRLKGVRDQLLRKQMRGERESAEAALPDREQCLSRTLVPLEEILRAPLFQRYSNYVMHCCRTPWPALHGEPKKIEGLFSYNDSVKIPIAA